MTIADLRRRREEHLARIRAMVELAEAEDRDFTREEQRLFDATNYEVEDLERRIRRGPVLRTVARLWLDDRSTADVPASDHTTSRFARLFS